MSVAADTISAAGLAFSAFNSALAAIPQGFIDTIAIQATVEETATDTVQLTEHPVEAGASITDHAYYKNPELVMRCGWSNSQSLLSTLTSLFSGGGATSSPTISGGGLRVPDFVSGIYSQLLTLQQSLKAVTVLTSIRQYTNMVVTSLRLTRDEKTSRALMVTATLRQVIIVNTVSTTLPPITSMANPLSTAETTNAGPQALQTGTSPNPVGAGGIPALQWPPGSDELAAGTPSD